MNAKVPAKLFCLIAFFIGVWLLIHKYYCLGYPDWDFAFFAQAMWSLTHGCAYVSLFDINFFSNHANLIALVLVPLYKIFPHPITLLVLKLLSFSVASYILYLLAEEKLGRISAFIILCLYWTYPPNLYGLVYEFDFENLAPAFIMLTFYFYTKEKWIPFLVSGIFLIMIKENMPLIIAAFGIHGLFTKSDKIRWGLVPTLLGGSFLYLLAFIFVPLMGGHGLGQHPYGDHYSGLNWGLLIHPWQAAQKMVTVKKILWLIYLFGPLPLSLLSPGTLFLALPILMQHFLSNVGQEHTIYFGYTLTIAPFVFLGFVNTLGRIKKSISIGKYYLILLITAVSTIIYLSGQMEHIEHKYMDRHSPLTAAYAWQLLRMVPPQAPVIASFRFLPELSQRADVYSFHKIYDPVYQNKDHHYTLPPFVHYALIDLNDEWLLQHLYHQEQFTKWKIKAFWDQYAWKVKYTASGIELLER